VLRRVAAGATKPIVGSFLAWPDIEPLLQPAGPEEATVPAFSSPVPAARALARAAAFGEWRRRPPGSVPELDGFDHDGARQVVETFLADHAGGGWLPAHRITELLGAIGVPVLETVPVTSDTEAAAQAKRLGFPVVLKASGPNVVHKSDVGGVVIDLASAGDVAAAYRDMAGRVGPAMTGAVVQRLARPGVETIVGVVLDPLFGPLVMFGMGGVAVELLRDRAFRILPLTDADAGELVRSLRASPLLFGYRGSAPVAVDAVEDVLQRVARLAAVVPELAELDFNPVIVSPGGVEVVDSRVRIVPAPPAPDEHLRRLS
jgi:acyl-CoA synthetase (NDP forming)